MFQHPASPFVLSSLFAASCMSVRRLFGLVSSFRDSAIALRICFPVTALSTSTASSRISRFSWVSVKIIAVRDLGLLASRLMQYKISDWWPQSTGSTFSRQQDGQRRNWRPFHSVCAAHCATARPYRHRNSATLHWVGCQ